MRLLCSVWALCDGMLRTLSGGEPSSNKWIILCASDKSVCYIKGARAFFIELSSRFYFYAARYKFVLGHNLSSLYRAIVGRVDYTFVAGRAVEDNMYQVLYRKYRPKVFSDVYGQDHVTSTLKNEIKSGRISHAYLFTGSRGTGKTTCAKILAKAVNCEHPENGNPCNKCSSCLGIESGGFLDVMELDAASNNGVDHVRALRDEAIYSPAQVKKRVYIIDEVHMLSIAAFNALLKTLEEPPGNTVILLLSENKENLRETIRSRCISYRLGGFRTDDSGFEGANEMVNALLGNEKFFYLKKLLSGYVKNREDAFKLLDGMEKIYRNFVIGDDERGRLVRSEDVFSHIELIEEARRDIIANVNYNYAIKDMIIKIGGIYG